jgi:PAS domain-containing protein
MTVDEIEIAWIEQHRKVAGFVAVIAALMFAGYAAVDWLLAPELLGRTLPWRVLGGALCLLSVLFVKTDALHKWAPLQMSVVAGIVTILVSVIFLGILRNPNVALTAQMQVMMAVMVLASLRTVVRVMIPPLLVSMNAGLWWNDATWQMFAMTNVLLVAASVLLVLVSETAYRTFVTRLALERTLQLQATIVQNSDEAIIARDLQGRVTSWNPGAERLFGYSEQEMLGQTMSSLSMPDRIAGYYRAKSRRT